MKSSNAILTAKLNNGKLVTAKNAEKQEVTLYVDSKGNNFWLNAESVEAMKTAIVAKLETSEKGDFFIANRDSRRTKLQGWQQRNPDVDVKDCPLKKEEQEEPLYYEGDKVERTPGITTIVGFATIEQVKAERELMALGAM